jgi:hypothetical protein
MLMVIAQTIVGVSVYETRSFSIVEASATIFDIKDVVEV